MAAGDGEPEPLEQSGPAPADETGTSAGAATATEEFGTSAGAAIATDEASGTSQGVLAAETFFYDDEAQPVGDDGATDADVGDATGSAPEHSDDTFPAWPSEPTGGEGATAAASSAEPDPGDSSGLGADREPGFEEAELLPSGSAPAPPDAVAASPLGTSTDPWSWLDDASVAAGADGRSPTGGPSPEPASVFLPPALAAGDPPEPDLDEAAQVNAAQPEAAHPEQAQPDDAQPDDAQPDDAQPDSAQPNGAQPEEPQPQAAQPEQAHPGGEQPERAQAETARPETARPEQATEAAQPEAEQPEQAQPQQAQPEQAQPEQAQPEQAQPEQAQAAHPEQALAAQPDQAHPEQALAAQPDQAQPDQAQPDQAQPDQAQPDQAQPDDAQPEDRGPGLPAEPEAGDGQGEAAGGAASPASVTGDVDGRDASGASGSGSSATSGGPLEAALPDHPAERPGQSAAVFAPAVPTAIWTPEPAPAATDDGGSFARAEALTDKGGGAGSPDTGEATAAGAPARGWAGSEDPSEDQASAALFELDLAKLAERARASALRQAAPAPHRSFEPLPEPDPVAAPDISESFPAQGPFLAPDPPSASPLFQDLFPAPEASPPTAAADPASARSPEPFGDPAPAPAVDEEPDRPVAPESAEVVADDATRAFDLSWDEEGDDEPETTEVAAGRAQPEVEGPVRASAPRVRQQPRYPRGQLREPIGILRRIRAMLGILLVTVLLGVAAGTAVGAFIFFLAFAVRNAITSQ